MKPILFSTPMVQAILDGRKTQTRRIIPDTDCAGLLGIVYADTFVAKQHPNKIGYAGFEDYRGEFFKKPIAQIGGILYVKETWQERPTGKIIYKADFTEIDLSVGRLVFGNWKPSLFMPKAYARIFLKVTNVRVERLQDITFEDIFAEGFPANMKDYFITTRYKDKAITAETEKEKEILNWWIKLWNSINKKEPEKQWEANPYVFPNEFERVAMPEVVE